MPKPFSVFISYSHDDIALRKELDKHLSLLKDEKIISVWTDSDIRPGTEWEEQIREKLNSAQIILLLVSSNFLASSFCRSVEMTKAIERHKANTARVIPIILCPVLWEIAPFGKLQALPLASDNRPFPVTSWVQHHDAWKNIALGIYDIANELEQKEKTSNP
jgi:TIR domain